MNRETSDFILKIDYCHITILIALMESSQRNPSIEPSLAPSISFVAIAICHVFLPELS